MAGPLPLACVDGCAEEAGGVGAAVDGDDLEAGGEACLVGDAVHDDVAERAGGAGGEAERVGGADAVAFVQRSTSSWACRCR